MAISAGVLLPMYRPIGAVQARQLFVAQVEHSFRRSRRLALFMREPIAPT